MDGRIDVTTLLFLVLAVVIFLKLRSVLGRRTGHEEARFERYKAQKEASQRNGKLAGQDKVVTLPRREREEAEPRPAAEQQAQADSEQRVKEYAAGNADMTKGLLDIVRVDTSFDPTHFLQGAKAAYEIIVTAFAEGNRKTLKDLLSSRGLRGLQQRHRRAREQGRADRPELRRHQIGRPGRGRAQGRHRPADHQVRQRADIGHPGQGRRRGQRRPQAHPRSHGYLDVCARGRLAQPELEAGRHASRKLANLATEICAGFLTGEMRFGFERCNPTHRYRFGRRGSRCRGPFHCRRGQFSGQTGWRLEG